MNSNQLSSRFEIGHATRFPFGIVETRSWFLPSPLFRLFSLQLLENKKNRIKLCTKNTKNEH